MSEMAPVPKDAPVMVAWDAYKASDEYQNTRNWALHEKHVDGSLWAAFSAGFAARTPVSCSPDVVERVAKALWHRLYNNPPLDWPGAAHPDAACVVEDARAAIEALDLESTMRREDAMQQVLRELVSACEGLEWSSFTEAGWKRVRAARAVLEGTPLKEGN